MSNNYHIKQFLFRFMNIAKKYKYFLLITLTININAFEIFPIAETPQVPINGDIDEVTDTDGVDVTHLNLDPKYPLGLMVVQDGNNSEKNKINKQNFKFVSSK